METRKKACIIKRIKEVKSYIEFDDKRNIKSLLYIDNYCNAHILQDPFCNWFQITL